MDWFFEWGEMPIEDEIQADVLAVMLQPKGTLFYNRGYGCSIAGKENSPSPLVLQVGGRYAVVDAVARRNAVVTNGTNGPERRVATSQDLVDIRDEGRGAVSVDVLYVPLASLRRPQRISATVGVI